MTDNSTPLSSSQTHVENSFQNTSFSSQLNHEINSQTNNNNSFNNSINNNTLNNNSINNNTLSNNTIYNNNINNSSLNHKSPESISDIISVFKTFFSLYETYLNWIHFEEKIQSQTEEDKKPQKLAKWFESVSYFETHRHIAYINEESFKNFQLKFNEYMNHLSTDLLIDATLSLMEQKTKGSPFLEAFKSHSSLNESSALTNTTTTMTTNTTNSAITTNSTNMTSYTSTNAFENQRISQENLENFRLLFLRWLIYDLMSRFSNYFSYQLFLKNPKKNSFDQRFLSLFINENRDVHTLCQNQFEKQLFLLNMLCIYYKIHEWAEKSHQNLSISLLKESSLIEELLRITKNEIQFVNNLVISKAQSIHAAFNNIIPLFYNSLDRNSKSQHLTSENVNINNDKDGLFAHDNRNTLLFTLIIMLKGVEPLPSLFLSSVLNHWNNLNKEDYIHSLFSNLSTEEDIISHPIISILLQKVQYLGDNLFPLLYILDSENEIYDSIFLLLVEKLQLYVLGNESRVKKQILSDTSNDFDNIKIVSNIITSNIGERINEILQRLKNDDKWLYILESIGIILGETVALQILLTMFKTYSLNEETYEMIDSDSFRNREIFFNLLSSYEKFHVHIIQNFCKNILWLISEQTEKLTSKSEFIIGNLVEFVHYLPNYIPHMKLTSYKMFLKNWRSLFPLTLLPIEGNSFGLRKLVLQIFEILLRDEELHMKLYLATDISNGLLSLLFFFLEPGVRSVWSQWKDEEDIGSTLYYRFYTKHDSNTSSYRIALSNLLISLWNKYEIWDESFRYFFELLCSRQMESRFQITSMMSSEIFEQTNFPLHYHHDVVSVLNSYFHHTFPKLSVSRDISMKDFKEITSEDQEITNEESATTLFQKLQQSMQTENQPNWKETVNIKRQHSTHIIQSYEATEKNSNEIIALISRCFDYTSPNREKKMNSFGNYLVSFTKRHYAPNRDQYTKMIPKKSTFDFDMYIGKLFTKFPIFYDFLKIVSTEPESFLKFSDVICSLWVNLIGEWNSTINFEKYAGNTDELIDRTKLYLYCLKTAQWIPPPFIYLDEMIHIFTAKEICDTLRIIWEYISTHIPTIGQFEGEEPHCSTPIKTRKTNTKDEKTKIDEFLGVLRLALENHIENPSVAQQHFGRVFSHIFSEKGQPQAFDE